MNQSRLARSDLTVSRLGFGCSKLGSWNSNLSVSESEQLIEIAFERGITLFDTASTYGQGSSERILGRALERCDPQHRAVVVSKIGYIPLPQLRASRVLMKATWKLRAKLGLGSAHPQRFDLPFLKRALRESEAWLGKRRVDVLMLHSPLVATLGDHEVVDWLHRLKDTGRVAAIGFSNLSPSQAVIDVSELVRCGVAEINMDPAEMRAQILKYTGVGSHNYGTTRMAAQPDQGVVDANCRVFGVDNLYIASSSVLPTASFANPGLTICAIGVRLGRHLKSQALDPAFDA